MESKINLKILNAKKNKLWAQIVTKMNQIGKYEVDWEECHAKYRNLLQTYKNNKDKRLKNSGESSITWEFFDLFDSVLGCKASTSPPNEMLSTSMEECTTMTDTDNENPEPSKKKIKKKLTKFQ